jgi:hypothetical protein
MDLLSIQDLLNEVSSEMPTPLFFSLVHDTPIDNELSQANFSSLCDEQVSENTYDKCYDKYKSYFSELEHEALVTFNNDFSYKPDKVEIETSKIEPCAEKECKSSALTKITILDHTPLTTEIDQSSVVSQESEEENNSPKENTEENKFSSDLSIVDANTNNFEDSDSSYKSSEEIFDENEVVFLVRKINKMTKTSKLITRHRKKITMCAHKKQEYYAKGMCKNCYHNKGKRSKKATKCDHQDRDHYAKGLCKNCYLHFFHIKKKERQAQECNQLPASTAY